MRRFSFMTLLLITTGFVAGCVEMEPTPAPDYRIKVMMNPDGAFVAAPPPCPSSTTGYMRTLDNQPWEQFGCASARNLAVMVEDPRDLIEPREAGASDPVAGAASVDLYRTGKTKPLLNTMSAFSSSQ